MTIDTRAAAALAARAGATGAASAARADAPPAERAPALAAPAAQPRRVVILGTDAALELALRESAADVTFVVAGTLTVLADLLTMRSCDALVVDVAALGASSSRTITQLAKQFPDLPIVAVGNRTDEAAIAGLISAGHVYRFLHRPLSPARARALLGAALRRPPPARPLGLPTEAASARSIPRRSASSLSPAAILACGIGLALLAIVAWWMLGAAPR